MPNAQSKVADTKVEEGREAVMGVWRVGVFNRKIEEVHRFCVKELKDGYKLKMQ